jgi:L-alanine-DL-glutamate epimerase-like enolase superfamily enzyme
MRIAAIAARTVRWPIAGTGAARGRSERVAVLVELRTARGATGLGEAAPLPGMSPDTLDDAEQAIAAFARFAGTALDDREAARQLVAATTASPAARFALETALFDALAREHGISVAALLGAPGRGPGAAALSGPHVGADLRMGTSGDSVPHRVHVGAKPPVPTPASELLGTADPHAGANALSPTDPYVGADRLVGTFGNAVPDRAHVGAEPPAPAPMSGFLGTADPHVGAMPRVPLAAVVDDAEAARRACAAGIRCLKIKLGPDDPLDRVRAIAAAAPGARLRIDANRSWPAAEVVDRLTALAALPVDYVEEPCRDAHRLLAGPLPCPLALDESLVELAAEDRAAALRSPVLAAVILKPALLGGLSACLALAAQARASGVAAVASHSLEGPIGTAACAELALALAAGHPPGPAAGLAPHAALAGWRLPVAQLAADHVHAAAAPGLGFADLDLAGALRALEPR